MACQRASRLAAPARHAHASAPREGCQGSAGHDQAGAGSRVLRQRAVSSPPSTCPLALGGVQVWCPPGREDRGSQQKHSTRARPRPGPETAPEDSCCVVALKLRWCRRAPAFLTRTRARPCAPHARPPPSVHRSGGAMSHVGHQLLLVPYGWPFLTFGTINESWCCIAPKLHRKQKASQTTKSIQ